ncbi:MAG: hypothetical protein JXA21_01480, partial [Anaerolineae bacterium]|nr:hypothetical protein [Anaerolineae bacterium]
MHDASTIPRISNGNKNVMPFLITPLSLIIRLVSCSELHIPLYHAHPGHKNLIHGGILVSIRKFVSASKLPLMAEVNGRFFVGG